MTTQSTPTAIERFSSSEMVQTNTATVYAAYVSGVYHAFFATEQEAEDYCSDDQNGLEFNGQWLSAQYSTFEPGDLFSVYGNETVYWTHDRSKFVDGIFGRWQAPFTSWE